MKRIFNIETTKHIGEKVNVRGWVHSRRDHGKIVFIDLRDNSSLLQVVCSSPLMEGVREESVLSIEGKIKERPKNMINKDLPTGEIELEAEKVDILAIADVLPFEIKEQIEASLPVMLDYRPLALRNEKLKAIFQIEETIIKTIFSDV